MTGAIRVVALADLGGLGAEEGEAAGYTWTPPSILPQLLPWIAVLLLLLLKPNRCVQAWWVWLPLLSVHGLAGLLRPLFTYVPSEPLELFSQVFLALAFGVTGIWLAAPLLGRAARWLAFLGMLFAAVVFGTVVLLLRGDTMEFPEQTFVLIPFVGFCGLQVALGLSLTSLTCRRRYGPLRFSLWLTAFLAAGWIVVSAPFVVAMAVLNGGPEWFEVLGAVLTLAGLTLVVVLPFLILAFTHSFYRERLVALLRLPPTRAPAPAADSTLPA